MKKMIVMLIVLVALSFTVILSGCSDNAEIDSTESNESMFYLEGVELLIECGKNINEEAYNINTNEGWLNKYKENKSNLDSEQMRYYKLISSFIENFNKYKNTKYSKYIDLMSNNLYEIKGFVEHNKIFREETPGIVEGIEGFKNIIENLASEKSKSFVTQDNLKNLEILPGFDFYRKGDYLYVEGFVKNSGKLSSEYYEVRAEFIDVKGNVIDVDYTNSGLLLKPNQRKSFKIMHKNVLSVSSVRLYINNIKWSE